MLKKSQLAKTDDDHINEGHVPPIVLRDNPGLTLQLVLFRCKGLNHFLREQIRATKESYEDALNGNGHGKKAVHAMLDEFLCPNIDYLREIEALPEEFKNFFPRKEFDLTLIE